MLGARGLGGHIGAMSVRQHCRPDRPRGRDRARRSTLCGPSPSAPRARGLGFLLWEIMPVAREYPSRLDETRGAGRAARRHGRPGRALPRPRSHVRARRRGRRSRSRSRGSSGSAHTPAASTSSRPTGEMDRHWPFTAEFNAQGIVRADHVIDLVSAFDRDEVELMLEPMFAFEAADEDVLAALSQTASSSGGRRSRASAVVREPAEAAADRRSVDRDGGLRRARGRHRHGRRRVHLPAPRGGVPPRARGARARRRRATAASAARFAERHGIPTHHDDYRRAAGAILRLTS